MTRSEASAAGRLHPATLLFRIIRHARGLLLPAIAVLLFSRGERWQIWLAVLFVPLVLFDFFQYFTLRWRYEDEELVLNEGWLFKRVRHIPYTRVQNVDLKQGVLHRALRVAEVKIETAGGGAEEAVLSVIGLDRYEELRARIFAGRAASGANPALPAAAPVETLLELGPEDLIYLAMNPTRGLAIAAVVWGFLWEFDVLDSLDLDSLIENRFDSGGVVAIVMLAAIGLLAAVFLVFVLSLAGTFLALWNFRLEQEGDVFRIRRGLLTRQVASIPRRRIQLVTIKESWIHRLLGRARVLVGTAGGDATGESGKADSGAQFAPILPVAAVGPLLQRIRGDLDLEPVEWQPLAPHATRRMVIAYLLPVLAVGALLILIFEWPGVLATGFFALFHVVYAMLDARRSGWSRTQWGIAWRSGAFSRATTVTFDDKVQTAAVIRSPFDRRHGHATLHVDTAGGGKTGHRLRIRYLPHETADLLRRRLVDAAATTRFRW